MAGWPQLGTWSCVSSMLSLTFSFLHRMVEYSLDLQNINLSAIRTVRVLRPLKAINRVPSESSLLTHHHPPSLTHYLIQRRQISSFHGQNHPHGAGQCHFAPIELMGKHVGPRGAGGGWVGLDASEFSVYLCFSTWEAKLFWGKR